MRGLRWLTLLLVLLAALPALAADPSGTPPPGDELELQLPPDMPPPGPIPPEELIDDLTHEISIKLRCPVCQGLSVADSPSESALTMKARIRTLVAAGYSEQQIQDYFVGRYGEWILLAPTASGLNWLLYLGPGVLLGLAFAWMAMMVSSWRAKPDSVPLLADKELTSKDPFEERLLRELEDDL